MKRKIKVQFVDVSPGFVPENDMFVRLLSKHYELVRDDDPEYLFCYGLGLNHVKYKSCVKIAVIGENVVPDFNWYDYAVGFDHMEFGDRYLRFPLWAFCDCTEELEKAQRLPDEALLNRDFCSFVVSAPCRNPICFRLFEELSKYKKVASGGRLLNNVGGPVPDKFAFCAKYKFNIACENSSSCGYVTEKILDPLRVGSVPIYWGDPRIGDDFSAECMVHVSDERSIESVVEEIIRLDRDDEAYLKKCRSQSLVQTFDDYKDRLEKFLCQIVEQPIEKARRLNDYGFQATQRKRLGMIFRGYQRSLEFAYKAYGTLQKLHLIK